MIVVHFQPLPLLNSTSGVLKEHLMCNSCIVGNPYAHESGKTIACHLACVWEAILDARKNQNQSQISEGCLCYSMVFRIQSTASILS